MNMIIKRPIITEKSTISNAAGAYVFEVLMTATKEDVKKAVETSFRTKVKSVRTSICRGRVKANRFGRGKAPHWKKAVVQLNEGEKISLFEGA